MIRIFYDKKYKIKDKYIELYPDYQGIIFVRNRIKNRKSQINKANSKYDNILCSCTPALRMFGLYYNNYLFGRKNFQEIMEIYKPPVKDHNYPLTTMFVF